MMRAHAFPAIAIATLLLATVASPPAGDTAGSDSIRRGAEAILRLDALPFLREGVQGRYVSSYDRTGGNNDGFKGTWSALREDKGEHVILEARGAGCVHTLWFTGPDGGFSTLPWGRLRIYFGSEEVPRVDVEANAFFSGADPRFPRPLVAGLTESSGGCVSYVPFEFREGIRITTERRCGFYNGYTQLYRDALGIQDGWPTGEQLGRLRALFAHRGSWRTAACTATPGPEPLRAAGTHALDAGKTVVLAELSGAGRIEEIRIDPLFPPPGRTCRS